MNELQQTNQEAVVEQALDAGEIPAFLERQEQKDAVLEVLDETKEDTYVQLVDDIH